MGLVILTVVSLILAITSTIRTLLLKKLNSEQEMVILQLSKDISKINEQKKRMKKKYEAELGVKEEEIQDLKDEIKELKKQVNRDSAEN